MSRLTKRDRHIIAKARELAAVTGGDTIRQYFGDAAALTYDTAQTYGAAFGEARVLLGRGSRPGTTRGGRRTWRSA